MIKFLLMISKSGRTCFSRYFEGRELKDRTLLESDLIRIILARKTKGCSFFDYKELKIVFRQFASVFIICGVDEEENEIGILEFIQLFVEVLDSYFPKVSDFDVTFNLEKVHIILEEMLCNGYIAETRKSHILAHLRLMESSK